MILTKSSVNRDWIGFSWCPLPTCNKGWSWGCNNGKFCPKILLFFVRPPVRLSHVSSKISCKFLSLVHILSIVQLLSTRCVSWASNMPELLLRPGLCPGPPLTARVARFLAAKYRRLLSIRDVRQGQHDAISYVCVCLFGFGCPQKLTGYYRSSRVDVVPFRVIWRWIISWPWNRG